MTGLEDAFGEDFVQEYKQTVAERREERQEVGDDTLKEIAHEARNEGRIKDGDPQFQFVTDSDVTHDVLLMQLPEVEGRSIFSYANELDSGAVTCPLDYLGEWMSCLFNDPEDLKDMNPGDYYLVIGNLDQWENDKGQVQDQMSPVRGVLSMDELKEYAESHIEGEVNEPEPEEEENGDGSEEDESSDDSGGSFLGGGDDDDEEEEDETEISYDEVSEVVEELAGKDEQVWELEKGDERVDKLVKVIMNRLEYPEGFAEEVEALALERVKEEQEEEDDDEDEGKLF